MTLRVVVPPAAYPVTREEAKTWLRVDEEDTTQDAIIDMLIAMATEQAEHLTGRAFVERTLELALDGFSGEIELPMPPLLSIVSVKYLDSDENEQLVATDQYTIDSYQEPGWLLPAYGVTWPSAKGLANAVKIRYQAGYRPTGSPIDLTDNSYLPPQLRTWMAFRIAVLYENREHLVDGRMVEIPRGLGDGVLDSLVIGSRLF